MNKIYGAVRISTGKQNMDRQDRNIIKAYPDAVLIKETYTGTKLEGRREFEHLVKILQQGDTLVFDSVSRMSRNSEEGCKLYEELFSRGVEIVFLKEPQVNTSVYRQALEKQIKIQVDTGNRHADELISGILEALNKYTISLAFEHIKRCFDQSEKEVEDLHQRTREGILTAKLNGKRVGQAKGTKLTTKKSIQAKSVILKHSRCFDGTLNDIECSKLAGITRNSFYKYKKELQMELLAQ